MLRKADELAHGTDGLVQALEFSGTAASNIVQRVACQCAINAAIIPKVNSRGNTIRVSDGMLIRMHAIGRRTVAVDMSKVRPRCRIATGRVQRGGRTLEDVAESHINVGVG